VLFGDGVADNAVNGAAHLSLTPFGPVAGDGSFFPGDLGLAANGLTARGLTTGATAGVTAIATTTTATATVACQGGAGDHGRQATREDEGQQLGHGCSSGKTGDRLEL
jgi:hypothetical protein